MAHADSFIINTAIASMHTLTARIFDVSNVFQNKNVPVHERVCVIPQPYYFDWFERSNPNVTINRDDGPFCLQGINIFLGKKTTRRQWNRLLDAVVTMINYKKSTIDHAIYIKVLTDGTVYYFTVSNDDVINNTNNDTAFIELTRVFKEQFEMKVQEG